MWLAVAVAAVNCAGGVALVPALGVAGTAWSSTAASSLAAALSLAVLAKGRGSALPARPRARDLATLARVAAPAAFQQVVVNLSYPAITSMTNAFGTAVVAGAGAATKANTLAGMPVWSAGQAVSAAAARCEGAGDRRRSLAYARAGLAVSVGATALVVLLVQAFAPRLVGLFADDPEAVAAGALYLRACCSANSLAYAAMYALDSFAQATGAPRLAAVNALLDAVVVRVGSRPRSATRASSPSRRSLPCCRALSGRRTWGAFLGTQVADTYVAALHHLLLYHAFDADATELTGVIATKRNEGLLHAGPAWDDACME